MFFYQIGKIAQKHIDRTVQNEYNKIIKRQGSR